MKYSYWIAILLFLLLLTLLVPGIALAQVPPSVTTEPATNVVCTQATLNGNLTSLGDASSVNVYFEFATDAYYTNNGNTYSNATATQSMSLTGTFNATIYNLTPSTVYHFRAVAVGNGTDEGDDLTFTTDTLPTVIANTATGITFESAVLNGNVNSLGNATFVNVSFQWGLTTSYGNTTPLQALMTTGPFNAAISGLSPNTEYHFRAKAVYNDCTSYSSDMTFKTPLHIQLEGWGWCTNRNRVVPVTFEGYTTMVERTGAAQSYSMHTIGNLTLPAPYNETISLDMYGSRVRSMFYLRQEITGKSATFQGTWLEASGNETYIGLSGAVALPNPGGDVLETARLCFVLLRTPDVEVPITEPGSFVEDVESMLTRFIKLVDKVLDSLIGTGFSDILSNILSKMATLLAHLRALGTPYIS